MLRALAGRVHEVVSGLCLAGEGWEAVEHDVTRVRFRPLAGEEIDAYVETGEWRDRAVEACLSGYREVMIDARLWPDDPWAAQRLIDFFRLEKALYEIEHEAAHRADQLRFPLAVILRMLSQQPSSS